ncbi:translational GTPase TypA [Salisediminibacterium beveridgei]|uniref:Large ribosomal subunit assembly factor BipA n=1 Tax=Salisediminibacterium beveridgei TaxID=632773 RepID=A0A1D7QVG6_9BACI|nr:translational GTPase TypA [Salisediminibacterium beveridgei]AOM82997.1 GTP-binding protein TypA/BipA [Salisediminibacterium beveridgei]
MSVKNNIRNIAIIAHVDHGKTTLVDELLKQSGTFKAHEQVAERAMDSNDIEKERGITILAKNTAVDYEGTRINILDTPGHADFGGEVERILKMVDGVLLVVDAFEGCMPQTRFVLKKAMEQKLRPVVVVNKIDRPAARPQEVVDEVVDLLIDLGADEDQLDFPVVYASALNGTSSNEPDLDKQAPTMIPVFTSIIDHVPAPVANDDEPLQFQVTMLDYNEYLGRIGVGRVFRGKVRRGDSVAIIKRDGSHRNIRISKMFGFLGLKRLEIEEASAGELIAIAGVDDIMVGETICPQDHLDQMTPVRIDEPTLQMTFVVNNSPFAGREGTHVTSRKIEERLLKQVETDVSLRVENTESPDIWTVSGRGELHLSILIENLRREGFELQVSKPEVIIREVDGVSCEPYEMAQVDVPEEYTGTVMESLGERKGELLTMVNKGDGQVRMDFLIPSRGLIGYTTEFMAQTKGYGIMNHSFDRYAAVAEGYTGGRRQGALVSMETGKVTQYAMIQVEDRGVLFVEPTTDIYEGMIVGEHNRDNDLTINLTKAKQQTNIRSATKEHTVTMKRPKILSLEEALEFLNEDEYCEITPQSIRLRKKVLNKSMREKEEKRKKLALKQSE